MDNINYIFDLIQKSDVTLIGYTYRVENIKDEIISKMPCYRLGEINSSFSFKAYMRDIKINQILDDLAYFKYIVLDIADVRVSSDDGVLNPLSRVKLIERLISNIRQDKLCNEAFGNYLGSDFDDPESHVEEKFETPYKLIITTPLYKQPSNEHDIKSFTGGSKPLYMADFAFVIKEPKLLTKSNIKVIKNRHDYERDNISLDGLKEYKYNEISNK